MSLRELKKAGFAKSGYFHRSSNVIDLVDNIQDAPGIYMFVVGGKIRYVGKTERSLKKRIEAYKIGLRKDLPRRKVHKGILDSIVGNGIVEIYTSIVEGKKQFFRRKGLPIDYLIGLEAGLIEHLDPGHWNPFGAAVRAKRARLRRDV